MKFGMRAPAALITLSLLHSSALSETLSDAISRAVSLNPTLRSQRAHVAATNEKLSQARSAFFPKISASADYGRDIQKVTTPSSIDLNLLSDGTGGFTPNPAGQTTYKTFPSGLYVQATQSLFDGGKTFAAIGEAKSLIAGAGEELRGLEQETIVGAATAYTNVLRANEIVRSRRDNLAFLSRQSELLRGLHEVGDVTKADLAITNARMADARYRLADAEAILSQARTTFAQITGGEPAGMAAAAPIDRMLPRTLDRALSLAQEANPGLLSAEHAINVANAQVRIAESDFYPTVGVSAGLSRRDSIQTTGDRIDRGYVIGKLSVPLFDGGMVASRTRESRAVLAQRQLERDAVRDRVRALVVSAWSNLQTSRTQISSAEQQAHSAQVAASAMAEQYRIGERSLTDLLLAQQELTLSRENLATATRDRVVASFALVQATGVMDVGAVLTDLASERPIAPRIGSRAVAASTQIRKPASCAGCTDEAASWDLRGGLVDPKELTFFSVTKSPSNKGNRTSNEYADGWAVGPLKLKR